LILGRLLESNEFSAVNGKSGIVEIYFTLVLLLD